MTAIASLPLSKARPSDRAHLLLWDTPNPFELDQITRYNNAQRVNYRENLLQRTRPDARFLTLHHQVEEEIAAIQAICEQTVKPVVFLEGLDCLITYLNVQPGNHTTLFWSSLENTRKLQSLLWIILPHKLVSKSWSETRLTRLP
ncbi:MAG: hypothetical protein HC780_23850 [Leptolyngbyaceae cyanobacterium CSU_1_3]|nr:hypothetical protein [Leptolyngbyaceae cyanobacterium CSU_1_3]